MRKKPFPAQSLRKKPCVKFLSGKCKREAACFYSHEASAFSQNPHKLKINTVCLYHLKGKCFYGEDCWYNHTMDIKFWIIEWFTDRVNLLFNDELNQDGKQTINDLYKIGEELSFLLNCFRVRKAQISSIHVNFSTLNFASDYIFNVYCCKTLVSITNLRSLQLSIACFELLLRKQDEINIILEKSVKLKNFTISDCDKMKVSQLQRGNWFMENDKIRYFTRQLRESYIEYFEIEAIRTTNFYDQCLKCYIFMLYSLMKSQILILKFSLNQDISFLINPLKSKIVITINYCSLNPMKELIHEFWEDLLNLTTFKEVSFNFISDWFSGQYSHELLVNKIGNLTYLELDFRRVNVNVDEIQLLWLDLKELAFLNNLKVVFPNAYIDQNILVSMGNYLESCENKMKVFFLKIKIMFVSEELLKKFIMIFANYKILQKIDLNLDFNLLQIWAEDREKQVFFENFLKKLLRNNTFLIYFKYIDRNYQFSLCESLENWLLLRNLWLQFTILIKREKGYKGIRKAVFFEIFGKIHGKFAKEIADGLRVRGRRLFNCFDMTENESEGAFYERFLQI